MLIEAISDRDSDISARVAPVATAAPRRRPSARAAIDLSIVIPALNEADRIGPLIARLRSHQRAGRVGQIIVVDGGSDDGTAEMAKSAGAEVIISEPSRGTQMNLGAKAARGDVLLFLHADTALPDRFDRHVARQLSTPTTVAGGFRLSIDGPQKSLRLIEKLVHWRSTRRALPYGDQAIFVRRQAFFEVGGYPQTPVMEDYVLMRRLRKIGSIGMSPAAVVTSARRWARGGIWSTTWLNQLTIVAFHLGISPKQIAAWRQRKLDRRR